MSGKASACAKTILFGEHAVVYNEPAIAIPLTNTRTFAEIKPGSHPFRIVSEKIGLNKTYEELIPGSGLQVLLSLISENFGLDELPDAVLTISSNIPIASGLGSGAAVSVAVIRAFADFYGRELSAYEVNTMAYEVEKVYHGTPSGIDNTTIASEQAILFSRSEGISALDADISRLNLLVIDSGIRSRTIDVVSDVRAHIDRNEPYIREIGGLVRAAVKSLKSGAPAEIGRLMNENQELLRKIDVSCSELDEWIRLGLSHGAIGGKLTGAGRGGNFLILAKDYKQALRLKSLYEVLGRKVIL